MSSNKLTRKKLPSSCIINKKSFAVKLVCGICDHFLLDPIIDCCGHNFCRDCIVDHLRSSDVCPVTKQELISTVVNSNKVASEFLEQEQFICRKATMGCLKTGNYSEMIDHIGECIYEFVKCSNYKCSEFILLKELEKHLAECRFTNSSDVFDEYNVFDTSQKHETVCPFKGFGCNEDFEGKGGLKEHFIDVNRAHLNSVDKSLESIKKMKTGIERIKMLMQHKTEKKSAKSTKMQVNGVLFECEEKEGKAVFCGSRSILTGTETVQFVADKVDGWVGVGLVDHKIMREVGHLTDEELKRHGVFIDNRGLLWNFDRKRDTKCKIKEGRRLILRVNMEDRKLSISYKEREEIESIPKGKYFFCVFFNLKGSSLVASIKKI